MVAISLYQRFEKRKNSKILYSPETIKIRFISRQNPVDFGGRNSPARQLAGGAETSSIENENQIFPQNPKFAMLSIAPRAGFEPATKRLTVARSTTELPRIA